jgi:Protein of unknown function (DUF3047)
MKFAIKNVAACAYSMGSKGLFFLISVASSGAFMAQAQSLQPFSGAALGAPPAPWRVVGLPGNKVPLAQIDVAALDGRNVLRLRTNASYGTASHALPANTEPTMLHWQWRLDQAVDKADLRTKAGDDAAVKVCAMFDLPLDALGFVERNLMRLARSASGEYLPAATLCYVWDRNLAVNTPLPNAYTRRLRWVVLDSASTPLGQWKTHQRDLAADFLVHFGDDSRTVPPLLAIVVGADSDNTGNASAAYVGDVTLVKQ